MLMDKYVKGEDQWSSSIAIHRHDPVLDALSMSSERPRVEIELLLFHPRAMHASLHANHNRW